MSSSSQRTPSLHDYDEDQYEPVIHDQAPIPRLERAINSAIIASAVLIIDKLYEGRAYPRFYALETVARVPYFSFLSVLHLYETLGFWRRADYLKVHFAETMNEFHHLLIMESMGGDERFVDRFFAQHMAVAYYFIACGMYLLSPRMAYNLSEQVEEHAYHTYDEFLEENEDELRKAPPPPIAVHYYTEGDLFFFDEFQTGSVAGGDLGERRRPRIDSLYDVFVNVRNDEAEHMKTMQFCQLPGTILRAPSEAAACSVTYNGARVRGRGTRGGRPQPDGLDEGCAREYAETMERTCEGLIDCVFHPGAFGDEEKGGAGGPGEDEGRRYPGTPLRREDSDADPKGRRNAAFENKGETRSTRSKTRASHRIVPPPASSEVCIHPARRSRDRVTARSSPIVLASSSAIYFATDATPIRVY